MDKTFNILGEKFVITPQMERMIKLQSIYQKVSHENLIPFDVYSSSGSGFLFVKNSAGIKTIKLAIKETPKPL